MPDLSSWFGGPSKPPSTSHHRPSPPRTHSHRSESPRRVFVRPHSPSGASITSRGFFSRPHRASTSSYKRSPREGYIARLVSQIRRLLRNLIEYARNNPMKMFMLVVMPLITGGALTKVLGSMGIRLPAGLAGMGGALGGGRGAGGGIGGAMEGVGGLEGVLKIAKMFM
ncbi:hypothetical protein MMC34_007335 [Xylographa carneopallida]|nr:hypothetical protein [Xylographa carneopallida]